MLTINKKQNKNTITLVPFSISFLSLASKNYLVTYIT